MLFADGFDDAVLGVGFQFNKSFIVYDQQKCIEILNRDMPLDEAVEYFYVNVIGSYVGESTPIFLERYTRKDIEERIEQWKS